MVMDCRGRNKETRDRCGLPCVRPTKGSWRAATPLRWDCVCREVDAVHEGFQSFRRVLAIKVRRGEAGELGLPGCLVTRDPMVKPDLPPGFLSTRDRRNPDHPELLLAAGYPGSHF